LDGSAVTDKVNLWRRDDDHAIQFSGIVWHTGCAPSPPPPAFRKRDVSGGLPSPDTGEHSKSRKVGTI